MNFTYRHGDRPLEGYTILRGIGRGGFGEVYYAVSDGGREVALKSIHQNHEIELRGVRQCMNLKCPQLVTIFDVHENVDASGKPGTPFIVMEYIEGPSLRDLLEQSPDGLSEEKAAFLVTEIAKGLAYLHEQGIVHRDLKPENIFYEDGYVKIGDYGLSKYISVSRQSGQTISVGTVHYMAPEIGSGNYHRGIDLYALGVILYELLTGGVPFEGTTMGEILMKHLSAEADLSGLSAGFRRVVGKALRKKPQDRYSDASALAADLLADRHLGDRIAALGPGDFSKYTARHARDAREECPGGGPPVSIDAPKILAGETVSVEALAPLPARSEVVGRSGAPTAASVPGDAVGTLSRGSSTSSARRVLSKEGLLASVSGERGTRVFLCALTVLIVSSLLGFLVSTPIRRGVSELFYLGSILAGTASVFLVESWAVARLRFETGFARRCAVTTGGAALLIPGYAILVLGGVPAARVYPYLPVVLVGLFCLDWRARVRRDRAERLLLGPALGAAFGGFLLSLLFDVDAPLAAAGILAGISLSVNVGAPFETGNPSQVRAAGPAPDDQQVLQARKEVVDRLEGSKAAVRPALEPVTGSVWESVMELKERMRSAARSSPTAQLIRPRREAVVGGVCAGLARYMDVRPLSVRITFSLFALLTWGWALLAYLIFWIKIPAADGLDDLPRARSAETARGKVRAVASSAFVSYLLIVLGLGGGVTLLIGAAGNGRDVLGLALESSLAGMAGWFLLTVAAYRLLGLLNGDRRTTWRPLLGGLVCSSLVLVGVTAVGALVSATLPGTGPELSGWGLAITWAVLLFSARLAVEAPRLFFSPLWVPREEDPGQPPGAAVWGLLGTTLVVAGMLIALVGVATTTGFAEAVFIKASIERHSAFLEFGQHREHFLIGLVLFLPGLFCHLTARRWGGGLHVLRGAVGLVGGGFVFGAIALFAPEYVQVSPDFQVSLREPVHVESMVSIYLLTILSFACLKWPGHAVQWRRSAPLASATGRAL